MASLEGYRVSRLAETDIEEIYAYTVKNWSAKQAETYYTEIITAFEGLVYGTKIGHDAAVEGYRAIRVGSHSVFYRIDGLTVLIVRVLHQSMDVSQHLKMGSEA